MLPPKKVIASDETIWMGAASAPSCRFGGIRGRQRSAIRLLHGTALHVRRAAHAWPRLGVQYERDICECVHRAAASRRTASARFGSTIRDSSSRQLNGRRDPADARPILRGEAMIMMDASASLQNARGCDDVARGDALGRFAHSAWAVRIRLGAIRLLESDPRSPQRRRNTVSTFQR